MKKSVLMLVFAISCTVFMTACGNSENTMGEEIQETASEEDSASEQEAASENDAASFSDTLLQDNDSEENTAVDDDSEQSMQADTTEEAKSSSSDTPATLSDDLYDFQISIDGTVYQFPMWYSDFEALGWEYDGDNTETLSVNQYTGSQCWKKDGFSVYTVFGNLSMNTVAFSDSMVAGIRIGKSDFDDCDWEILLPADIKFGVSTTEDIKAAYGEPASDYDGSMFYKMTYHYDYYREIDLYVYADSGVLEEIRIENLIELEGVDDSVSTEVPDMKEPE